MVVEFSDRAFFVIQHQVSSIQHLRVNRNGLNHIGQTYMTRIIAMLGEAKIIFLMLKVAKKEVKR